jgi:peptide/nickel transport system permease protein
LLTGTCLFGPLVLPRLPVNDPLHSALLPPGTLATELVLDDGTTLVAPDVRPTPEGTVISGAGRRRIVASERIVRTRPFRFWLGSDRFGHDVLRQLLVGGRISLAIAALSVVVALAVGGVVGIAAGAAGGVVDAVLMRTVDALLAFPVLFLMILAAALFRPGPVLLVALLGLTSWMGLARLVRGQVLSLRSRPFILAARTSGSRWHRIAAIHYAPNLVGPVSQDTALRMGDLVIAEATLSYLGLGIPPSIPTWGSMIADGHRVMLDGWWLAVVPGLAIAWLVISLALIGDGLQQRGEPST